jgi:hypothetical protein
MGNSQRSNVKLMVILDFAHAVKLRVKFRAIRQLVGPAHVHIDTRCSKPITDLAAGCVVLVPASSFQVVHRIRCCDDWQRDRHFV